jgi:hypothetical protein
MIVGIGEKCRGGWGREGRKEGGREGGRCRELWMFLVLPGNSLMGGRRELEGGIGQGREGGREGGQAPT